MFSNMATYFYLFKLTEQYLQLEFELHSFQLMDKGGKYLWKHIKH